MSADTMYVGVREVSREREIDPWLEEAMVNMAPQALLRDLHRPIKTFTINPDNIEKVEIPKDAGRNATGAIKRCIFASYRVPIVELIHTNRTAAEAFRDARALLRLPWANAPRTGSRSTPYARG